MRIFFFLLLLPISAFSQLNTGTGVDGNCNQVTIAGGAASYDCIDLTLNASPAFGPGIPAIVVRVQGNVSINAAINLSGSTGINTPGAIGSGGAGGPGATDGGEFSFGIPQNGNDASSAVGIAGDTGAACGGGGGGAGFALAGTTGVSCLLANGGTGGVAVPATDFDLGPLFRGGFGGGSGGPGVSAEVGTGGGGGGSIHLIAGGGIVITVLGSILANGGPGGNGITDGGGGGGGSGGAIWLQAIGNITNNGIINAIGGLAGTGVTGNGGPGGRGIVQLEDLDGTIAGSGTTPGFTNFLATGALPTAVSTPSLKSDISCGTIKPKDENQFYQMSFGFLLAIVLGMTLKFFSKSKRYS